MEERGRGGGREREVKGEGERSEGGNRRVRKRERGIISFMVDAQKGEEGGTESLGT